MLKEIHADTRECRASSRWKQPQWKEKKLDFHLIFFQGKLKIMHNHEF